MADGSCMIVIATDAPLTARDLQRLAARGVFGLARTGSSYSHGSGDFAIAFSTAADVRTKFGERDAAAARDPAVRRRVGALSGRARSHGRSGLQLVVPGADDDGQWQDGGSASTRSRESASRRARVSAPRLAARLAGQERFGLQRLRTVLRADRVGAFVHRHARVFTLRVQRVEVQIEVRDCPAELSSRFSIVFALMRRSASRPASFGCLP